MQLSQSPRDPTSFWTLPGHVDRVLTATTVRDDHDAFAGQCDIFHAVKVDGAMREPSGRLGLRLTRLGWT
jgi:hypothetical protein